MAAVTSYAEWVALCAAATSKGFFSGGHGNGSFGGTGTAPASLYQRYQRPDQTTTPPGATVALDCNDYAALLKPVRLQAASTKKLWLAEMEWGYGAQTSQQSRSICLVYDRLSHQSGLDGTVADATGVTFQTTNLPTAALPRYADGAGVMIALEIYSAVGATAALATVQYTNQDGVSGRLSQPIVFGSGTANSVAHMLLVPLKDGDTGVRSVEGVNLSGTTGTTGNFGITLLKPLAFTPCDTSAQTERNAWKNLLFGGCVVEVKPGACLALMLFNGNSNSSTQAAIGRIGIVEK